MGADGGRVPVVVCSHKSSSSSSNSLREVTLRECCSTFSWTSTLVLLELDERETVDVASDALELLCSRGKGGVYVGGGVTTDCIASPALWMTK